MARGFAAAAQFHAATPWKLGVHGHRVFWVRGRDLAWLDLPARRDAYAILGRHTRCDLRLPHDEDVSLRHVLVRSCLLADGNLALRVLDLRSGMPFFLEDDRPRASIVAAGPVAIRLGEYSICAFPVAPGSPTGGHGPYRELPRADVAFARVLPRGVPDRRGSYITVMPPAPSLEDLAWPAAPDGSARVTLRHGDRAASVVIPDADLDLGVIVGRADRCVDRGLRAVLTMSISRSHLLLLREGDDVHAFDLCSSQGTRIGREPIRRSGLPPTGARLVLASLDPVFLDWHPRLPI